MKEARGFVGGWRGKAHSMMLGQWGGEATWMMFRVGRRIVAGMYDGLESGGGNNSATERSR